MKAKKKMVVWAGLASVVALVANYNGVDSATVTNVLNFIGSFI